MHIERCKLSSIRGFEELELDFRRPDGSLAGWTVIAGRNGSGKTTLLRALALATAGPNIASVLAPDQSHWIRQGARSGTVELALRRHPIDRLAENSGSNAQQRGDNVVDLRWAREINSGNVFIYRHTASQDMRAGPWAPALPHGWFVAGYGPSRRIAEGPNDAARIQVPSGPVARLSSLFRQDVALAEVVGWLQLQQMRSLEKKKNADSLLNGVIALLNDGLLADGAKITKITSDGLFIHLGGIILPLRELSDGYRDVAALVLDLAYRMFQCYGEFKIRHTGGKITVPYPGVVLIDEAEQHLHVAWQQRIGFWLKHHFPKVQFIVTTHSPFICQAADPNGLIRLPGPNNGKQAGRVSDETYQAVVNGSIEDATLSDLFGLDRSHSDESERLRERLARLESKALTKKLTAKERAEANEIRHRLPRTTSAEVEQALRKLAQVDAKN